MPSPGDESQVISKPSGLWLSFWEERPVPSNFCFASEALRFFCKVSWRLAWTSGLFMAALMAAMRFSLTSGLFMAALVAALCFSLTSGLFKAAMRLAWTSGLFKTAMHFSLTSGENGPVSQRY